MRVCMVTAGSINGVWHEKLAALTGRDVVVFGFNGLGLVSYKKELAGETEYFQDVAKLSGGLGSVVISGCDTDTYGVFRHSAVIADRGKILGVSDMARSIDDSEFVSGGSLRVYDTSAGRIGVLVEGDLLFSESARVLALCDAELIVCVMKKVTDAAPQLMLRAGAFSNGVAMLLVGKNYAAVSDIRGKIATAGSADVISAEVKIEKDYRLISERRRGLTRG